MSAQQAPSRSTVCLYVCTYRRNEALTRLLHSVERAAKVAAEVARVGVVVVDDNVDGRARVVADDFDGTFELGIHYRHTGSGNISVARNTGLVAAAELADWVAMTDDDCEVSEAWFVEFLRVLAMTGADACCGPHIRTVPPGTPAWLARHPFLIHDPNAVASDGEEPEHGQTNNSIISSRFVLDHPEVRFDPDLGKVGGEDMVFFHEARQAGLRLTFAQGATVTEEAAGARLTMAYYLKSGFWFGNTQYVTSRRTSGLTKGRAVLRGGRRLVEALVRPVRQLARREPPELRYSVSLAACAVGLMLGPLGVRLRHPS